MFYDTFLSYLEKWGYYFDDLKILRWIQLIICPTWDDVQQSMNCLIEKNKNNIGWKLDEDDLFDEFNHIVNIFKIRVHEQQKNCTKVEKKWCEIFEYMVNQNIGLLNISGIIEYAFAIPGTMFQLTINILY